ncbi:Clp protease N-terminal domain-containing protein [Streptomyces chartreusis]|uniref:Clp protease N-terminal domain-containing protein n=1 Tax=Streptomyces chartreusis TaxID=1969 RepID=UPI00340B0FCC
MKPNRPCDSRLQRLLQEGSAELKAALEQSTDLEEKLSATLAAAPDAQDQAAVETMLRSGEAELRRTLAGSTDVEQKLVDTLYNAEQDAASPRLDRGVEARPGVELASVIASARRRAVRDGDAHIDTAYLLHALLEIDPDVRAVFDDLSQLARLLGHLVQRSIGYGLRWQGTVEDIASAPTVAEASDLSPAAARALADACARAGRRGEGWAGGLDLFVAIVGVPGVRAGEVLQRAGVDAGALLSRAANIKQPAADNAAESAVAALAAGVSARLRDSQNSMLAEAYASLREAIRHHLAAQGQSGERILEASENASAGWQTRLRDLLAASRTEGATELLAAADFLNRQLDQSSAPKGAHLEFGRTRGVTAGDHHPRPNTFK